MSDRSRDSDDFFRLVERLPFVGSVARELSDLRALLVDRRPARILAVGAREAGKSALANALLGAEVLAALPPPPRTDVPDVAATAPAPRDTDAPAGSVVEALAHDLALGFPAAHGAWLRVRAEGRQLAWLELAPAHRSDDAARTFDAATELTLTNALDEHLPDVVLAVVHAERLDAELAPLGAAVQRVLDLAAPRDTEVAKPGVAKGTATPRAIPVLVVVTASDRLARPAAFARPPYPTDALTAIDAAATRARQELTRAGVAVRGAYAVTCLPHRDERWNLSALGDAIYAQLPASTHVESVRALPVSIEHVRDVARAVVNHVSGMAVTIGLAPIPFADAFVLVPLQGLMVTSIAYIAGQPWDKRAALEWLGTAGVAGGAALGLRWGAQQLVKLVPGAGVLVSASVAGAGTLALGRSAIAYFVEGPGRRIADR